MKTIKDYLDDLKEKTGSDYKTAQKLNIDKSAISNIRKRHLMSDETAIKIANALEIDAGEVLVAAAMARSKGEIKTKWEEVMKKISIAACFAMLLFFNDMSNFEADYRYYVKLDIEESHMVCYLRDGSY